MGQALLWNKQSVKNYTLKFCKERFLLNQRVFYFPKDFYLIEEINHQISVLSANGILSFINSQYVDSAFLNVKSIDIGPQPLNFTQISGIFYVCGVCLLVSLAVFAVEVFKYNKFKWRNHYEFVL